MGKTITAGRDANLSGGRILGTTIVARYYVGILGGHPEGTTLAAGYVYVYDRTPLQEILHPPLLRMPTGKCFLVGK